MFVGYVDEYINSPLWLTGALMEVRKRCYGNTMEGTSLPWRVKEGCVRRKQTIQAGDVTRICPAPLRAIALTSNEPLDSSGSLRIDSIWKPFSFACFPSKLRDLGISNLQAHKSICFQAVCSFVTCFSIHFN